MIQPMPLGHSFVAIYRVRESVGFFWSCSWGSCLGVEEDHASQVASFPKRSDYELKMENQNYYHERAAASHCCVTPKWSEVCRCHAPRARQALDLR